MNNISKAFVFDFDDTIAKTKCKINVYEGEELVDKITPEEFNSYDLDATQRFGFEEFRSEVFIKNAKPTGLMNLVKEVYEEDHAVFVLTAREDDVADAILSWMLSHGIKPKTVYCVGGDKQSISRNKSKVLLSIMKSYDKTYFYDDCPTNIRSAPDGKNLKKYKV